jgi:hypothetical protein
VNAAAGNGRGGDAGPRENAGMRRCKAPTKRGAQGRWRKPAVRRRWLRKQLPSHCTSRGVVAERGRLRSADVLVRGFAHAREVLVAVSREKSFEGQECSAGKFPGTNGASRAESGEWKRAEPHDQRRLQHAGILWRSKPSRP